MQFVFRHLRRGRTELGRKRLEHLIRHAAETEQIKTYGEPGRSITPFKSILDAETVTVCMAIDRTGKKVAQGYSFCRGDAFCKKEGRWRAENRVRKQLGMELLKDEQGFQRKRCDKKERGFPEGAEDYEVSGFGD